MTSQGERAATSKQGGQTLWWLVLASATLFGLMLTPANHSLTAAWRGETAMQLALAQAKEALIARAVVDDNRPGSLPCPDLMTNSNGLNNHPGDGKADMFTLTQCPSYVGWLPWVTLDLAEAADDSGTRLWYALAPGLRDDDSAHPINSETATGLWLDGATNIAAIIIASRAPLAGQLRPGNNPRDYLERANSQADQRHYVSGPAGDDFNDRMLAITRHELMAAVEKRIAGELKRCLNSHAAAPANPDHRFPWPSPLSNTNFNARAGSLFGRFPATQADGNPDAKLRELIGGLNQRLQQLAGASNTAQQLAELAQLSEYLVASRNLLDIIFLMSNTLHQEASSVHAALTSIEKSATDATIDNRISRSEGSQIRTRADSSTPTLNHLTELIGQYGIDIFPWRLEQLATQLDDSKQLKVALSDVTSLLASASSQRPDFISALAEAINANNDANAAYLSSLGDPSQQSMLSATVQRLQERLHALANRIEASQISRSANDIAGLAQAIRSQLNDSRTDKKDLLLAALGDAENALNALQSGLPAIGMLRNESLSLLGQAKTQVATSNGGDSNPAAGEPAVNSLFRLVDAIAANERTDNNLSHSSLLAAMAAYSKAHDSFVAIDTATPRPLQRDIVPYAEALGKSAVNPALLAKTIADQSAALAILAKTSPLPAGSDPAKAVALENSAMDLAEKSRLSIVDRNQTRDLLSAYQTSPSQSRLNKANTALAETLRLGQATLAATKKLEKQFASSSASAMPMLWYSQDCDFLRPSSLSWWHANHWQARSFYQISGPLVGDPAKLQVNGQQGIRLAVILAGERLASQNSGAGIANFLEAGNADPSREGDATAPASTLEAKPLSSNFNDRLSW